MIFHYSTSCVKDETLFCDRNKQEEMVLADMQIKPGTAWEYCPREALRQVSKVLKDEFNLVGCTACLICKLKYCCV